MNLKISELVTLNTLLVVKKHITGLESSLIEYLEKEIDKKNFAMSLKEGEFMFDYGPPPNQLKILGNFI